MSIDYDKFGHCCYCHKHMLKEEVVGGKIIKRWTPDFDESEYLLNDGSKMRVTICKQCKGAGNHLDTNTIMNKVIKGWKTETDLLVADENKPAWTKEVQEAYMKEYSKKEIVIPTEGHDADSLKVLLDSHPRNRTPQRLFDLKKAEEAKVHTVEIESI